MKTSLVSRSLAVAGSSVALLLAAQAVADDEQVVQLSPVQVTANRGDERSLVDVPQMVTVVDAASVARQTQQILTDLLRGQAGVFLQSSGPGQGVVIARGLKGSEVLHLVDGMRLNMSFMRNSPSQYIALIDPYNVERIELLRGTGSTLYGSDALGGVLQVFTPEYRFDANELQVSGKARALYSSADLAKVARAEAAIGQSGFSLSGGYTTMDFGERDIGSGGRQPFSAYRMRGGDAKLLWEPAAGHELMVSMQYMESPKLPRHFEIVGGPGGEGSGLPVYFEPNDRRFAHARYRITTPLGFADQIEVHMAQQIINDDRVRVVNENTQEKEQNRSTLNGFTVQARSRRNALDWTYGLDIYDDGVDSAKSRTNTDSGELSSRTPTFPDGATTLDTGVYVKADWQAATRWLLQGGLRYDRIRTELSPTPLSAAATIENSDVTAHLGSMLTLSDELRWVTNLARGFRAPNIFDLGTIGPRPNSSPQIINAPNPGLGKETIVSVDSGFKWSRPGLYGEVSLFRAWHDNRIESREPTGRTIAQGDFGCEESQGCAEVASANLAEARFWGVESMLRANVAPMLEAYATLNYTYGEERRNDEVRPANRIPPLNGQAGLAWTPGTLRIEPYLRFASGQDRLDDDDQDDLRIDPLNGTAGYLTVNLRVGWTPLTALRLQIDGINMLDKAYREHGSGIDGQGAGIVFGAQYAF